MNIYVDAMGGDHAPIATVEGSLEALERFPQITIELGGPIEEVTKAVDRIFASAPKALRDRVVITDCPDVIQNCESPVMAVRKKKNSSIVDGMLKVRDKHADAFVSAGSTGAVLAGGMFRLGRIPGIERPALAPLLPNGKDYFLLVDCGANVDCQPEYLRQFALMGNAYMQGVRGIKNPRIGLINNGAEAEKGCTLTKEAYTLIKDTPSLNFVGNIEARYITADQADVLVCDGFVGNVVLKFMEGIAGTMMGIIKDEMLADKRSSIGALLVKPAFGRVKKKMDYSEVGGAPLLGVRGNVIKAHGSSSGHALACAIGQAVLMVDGQIPQKIESLLTTGIDGNGSVSE